MSTHASSSYAVHLTPAGFHPTLHLTLPSSSDLTSCPLYAHITLPSSFIADRFQLAQLHVEGKLGSLGAVGEGNDGLTVVGERDLEAPVSRAGGGEILLRVREGSADGEGKGKGKGKSQEEEEALEEVVIPLHMRYQLPAAQRWINGTRQDMHQVEMPWPLLFWLCANEQTPPSESLTVSCPPSTLPSHQFPPSTTLHFLRPPLPLINSTRALACHPNLTLPPALATTLPTGVSADLPWVEGVNFLVVWGGTLWVAWTAWRVWRGKRRDENAGKSE